jgi:hypothetical protein
MASKPTFGGPPITIIVVGCSLVLWWLIYLEVSVTALEDRNMYLLKFCCCGVIPL